MSKNKKVIITLSCIAAALLLIVIVILSIFFIKNAIINSNNKKAAGMVIAHIEQIDNSPVTIEDENLIMSVKTEYDLLTDKQKGLVTNFPVLEKALNDLQSLKDKKVSDELVSEIKRINKSTLTADNTSVAALLERYDSLTDSQKALVTNYDLLLDYKDIVDQKIAELEKKNAGIELAENFEGYEGKWGKFGAHVNSYQGMIEAALHDDVNYKKYFSTAVNSLDFRVSRFEKNTTVFGIGISYFSFKGIDKDYGYETTLYGEIIIKEDGSLYASVNGYY